MTFVAAGTPYVAFRNIGVTALFACTVVVFPLKQETVLILWAMQGLKSNLYSISLLLSTTAATNQFIVLHPKMVVGAATSNSTR